ENRLFEIQTPSRLANLSTLAKPLLICCQLTIRKPARASSDSRPSVLPSHTAWLVSLPSTVAAGAGFPFHGRPLWRSSLTSTCAFFSALFHPLVLMTSLTPRT
ncbi:hypothetical protein CSUI_009717, partial [Cystoisospora suis]